jgi:hypothetical protein
MRRCIRVLAAFALMVLPAALWAQERGAQGGSSVPPSPAPASDQQTKSSAGLPAPGAEPPAPPQPSLATAARKAREQKKSAAKTAKVYTNDNIPTSGGISAVGAASSASAGAAPAAAASATDEKTWRDKFAMLHQKLDSDKQNLEVMQRELGVLDVQYYNDPVKAMQQQLSREDINKKTADIDAKKKQIADDQQAIDDAEDDLRKAGGDPGWAR